MRTSTLLGCHKSRRSNTPTISTPLNDHCPIQTISRECLGICVFSGQKVTILLLRVLLGSPSATDGFNSQPADKATHTHHSTMPNDLRSLYLIVASRNDTNKSNRIPSLFVLSKLLIPSQCSYNKSVIRNSHEINHYQIPGCYEEGLT